jgi:hypothetical protein
MKKSKITSEQVKKILQTLNQKKVTRDVLQSFGISNGLIADVFEAIAAGTPRDRETWRQVLGLGPLAPTIRFDYSRSLPEMTLAAALDQTSTHITDERFPIHGQGIVTFETKLFCFEPESVSSEEAVIRIKAADRENLWSPAKIEHLLTYSKTFPDEQRKYPIVGLGSSYHMNSNRYVPIIDGSGSDRSLDLGCWGGDWSGICQFLAVRVLSS